MDYGIHTKNDYKSFFSCKINKRSVLYINTGDNYEIK